MDLQTQKRATWTDAARLRRMLGAFGLMVVMTFLSPSILFLMFQSRDAPVEQPQLAPIPKCPAVSLQSPEVCHTSWPDWVRDLILLGDEPLWADTAAPEGATNTIAPVPKQRLIRALYHEHRYVQQGLAAPNRKALIKKYTKVLSHRGLPLQELSLPQTLTDEERTALDAAKEDAETLYPPFERRIINAAKAYERELVADLQAQNDVSRALFRKWQARRALYPMFGLLLGLVAAFCLLLIHAFWVRRPLLIVLDSYKLSSRYGVILLEDEDADRRLAEWTTGWRPSPGTQEWLDEMVHRRTQLLRLAEPDPEQLKQLDQLGKSTSGNKPQPTESA